MLFHYLDLFGTAIFAASGALVAARKNMDIFGALVLAFVTAIGGGSMRDALIGRLPVFWLREIDYLITIIAAVALTRIAGRFRIIPRNSLLVADAFGLALFTIIGADVGIAAQLPAVSIILLAILTGVGGGAARDVLAGEMPLVLHQEIYATAALIGAIIYLLLLQQVGTPLLATGAAMTSIFLLRLAAIYRRWHLPRYIRQHYDE